MTLPTTQLPPIQLHLVRLWVDPRALSAFAVGNGLSDDDAGYALHSALRDRFGAAGPQPFRYLPDHKAGPHVLGYAADKAGFHDAAGLPAADALLGAVFTGAPEGHDMPVEWREGARYRFEVRVRPVVRFGKSVRAARRERPPAHAGIHPGAGEAGDYVLRLPRPRGDPPWRSRPD